MSDSALELERRVFVELLGIPIEKCPPHYFTLLDVPPSVEDVDAIEAAARRRAALLRSGVPNELHLAARLVLKRIDKARVCLIDADARSTYLASLRTQANTNSRQGVGTHQTVRGNKDAGTKPPGKLQRARDASPTPKPSGVLPCLPSNVDLPPLLDESILDELPGPGLDLGPTTLPIVRKKSEDHLALYLSVAGILCAILAVVGLTVSLSESDEVSSQREAGAAPAATKPVTSKPVAANAIGSQAIASAAAPQESEIDADAKRVRYPKARSASVKKAAVGIEKNDAPKSTKGNQLPHAEVRDKTSDAEPTPVSERPSFEGLVREVTLPAIRNSSSGAVISKDNASIVELGILNDATIKNLQVSLNQPKAFLASSTSFQIRPAKSSQQTWHAHLNSEPKYNPTANEKASQLDDTAVGFDEIVATLEAINGQLKFKWANPKRASMAEHLRNCVLHLRADQLEHRIPLRPTQTTYRFVTDLTERNMQFEIDNHALPKGLVFQVGTINLPGANHEIEPTDGVIQPNETLRIKLLDWEGQAELQFKLAITKSTAVIRFTPRHKLGSRWYPFTSKDVNESLDDLNQALSDARATHSAANSAVSSLRGRISSAEASYSRKDHARSLARINALRREFRSAQGALRRTSRSIPEFETKIPYLESLANVGRRIHQVGSIEFRVFVPLDDGELVLFETGQEDPPQLSEAEDKKDE
jgi:hypothetical protein